MASSESLKRIIDGDSFVLLGWKVNSIINISFEAQKTLKRVLFCCFWLRAPIVFADNSVSVDFSLNIYYWLLFLGPWGTQHYMTCRHDSQESYTFPGHQQRCLYLLIYSLLRYYVPGTSSILSDVSLGSLPLSYYPIKILPLSTFHMQLIVVPEIGRKLHE